MADKDLHNFKGENSIKALEFEGKWKLYGDFHLHI